MTFDTAPVTRLLDGMVHDSVADDHLSALRHRQFIAVHLCAGLLVLAAIPVWLAVIGPTSVLAALTFSWLLAPLAIAGYLSRSGRLGVAQLASSVAFAGLIVWVAGFSGGMKSPALAWLVLIPLVASFSGTERAVAAAVVVAVLGIVGLVSADTLGLLSPASDLATSGSIYLGSIMGLVVCATGLAMSADRTALESSRLATRGAARLRSTLDNVGDLITRHSANGDVEYASPSVQVMTGMSAGEALGQGLFQRVHPHDRPIYLRALSEAYVGRGPMTSEIRLQQRSDGGEAGFLPVEMRSWPINDGDADAKVVAVTRDISRGKAYQNELQQARLSAEQASRAKTQYLAQLSHEVRTPLNAIIGFSEFLESDIVDQQTAERKREYAKLIRLSGEHLLQLVDGILEASKIESGRLDIVRERIRIAPLIAECCDMLARQADERGVFLECATPNDLPEIAADARACRQMLINLLSNAIKFTDRGGVVTVGAKLEGESIALFVRDTGIGISAEDLPRLGTPFVQAEAIDGRESQGTGLGLSMVKGLAALHGGRLEIESKPAVGTTATAILPINGLAETPVNTPAQRPGTNDEERKSA